MAATPLFGGTNGVPELDAGQRGSAREAAGTVEWTASTREGPPEVREVLAALPEQNQAFQTTLGWSGQRVTWTGSIRFKNAAELGDFRSVLNLYRFGQTLDRTTGLSGAVNVTYLKPTILKDSFGNFLGTKWKMVDWQFGDKMRGSSRSGFLYSNNLTIVFRKFG